MVASEILYSLGAFCLLEFAIYVSMDAFRGNAGYCLPVAAVLEVI
jgi:hypothetical protein